ncbi:hypothetical protein [Streptomyces sp. H27-C3]|uniref:COG1470 family protein n=1 Tax=Streptomyces sp. H27-C3 TaxID=3046305 RepID=UPI0024B963C5|nr:hypothetical protein [Streptomyces sp. H27-C3]MDJ0466205.1 hypothetical protein [Streptomyces sp. H27-C3]
MTLRAELIVPDEPVPPGESLTAHLHVWNEGRIVDAYDLELLGPPAVWSEGGASLGQLPVYPGNHEKINIPIAVPRDGDLAPGALPFAIRVVSTENPDVVEVPEAAVVIGEFRDVELEPVRSRTAGALWANNLVVLRNTGNVTMTVRLKSAPEQTDAPLRVRIRRSRLALAPGEKARVALAVRMAPPVWVGAPAQWKVTTSATWGEEQTRSADFVHRQRALLPKPVFKALTVLTALVVAAAVLWFSPAGKKTPTAKTESAPGLSQADAVEQKEKKAAAREKEQEEKDKRQEEAEGALRKKTLQKALFVDSESKVLTDRYKVPKGYRLVLKTAQITASGTETSTLLLEAGGKPLASMSTRSAQDFTPKTPVVVKAGDTVTLTLDCKAPPPPADDEKPDTEAGGGSDDGDGSGAGGGSGETAACTATALVSGDLVPLEGPFSEPDPSRPSAS